MTPKFAKSIIVREVYMEAAEEIFKRQKNLQFLSWGHNCTGQGDDSRQFDLPSWTPSWHNEGHPLLELQTAILGEDQPHDQSLYAATAGSTCKASFDLKAGSLRVLGFVIDVIQDASPTADTRSAVFDGPPRRWTKSVFGKYPELVEPFWRVILADQWADQRITKGLPDMGSIPPRTVEEAFELRKAASSYQFNCAFRHRKLFVSLKHGLVGLAPFKGRPGDIIFATFGCDVPHAIRRCENGFLLLGEW
jgi:hypothetical protein